MKRFFLAAALAALPAAAQTAGSVELPEALAAPGTPLVWAQKVRAYCEGPAPDGVSHVYFTEQHGKDTLAWPIWKLREGDPAHTGAILLTNTDQANGLGFDPQGRLVACQRRKISRFDAQGNAQVLADSSRAAPFSFANDLSFASDGSFFFTALDSNLYRGGPDGGIRVLPARLKGANGILYLEERNLLYVCDAVDSLLYRFDVGPGGDLSARKPLFEINRPDGMAIDALGNLYIASYTEGAILVYNPEGSRLGRILPNPPLEYNFRKGIGGNVSNCAFGGPDLKTLYITGDGGLYSVRLTVAGRSKHPLRPTALAPAARLSRGEGRGARVFDALARCHPGEGRPAARRPVLYFGR